VCYLQMYNCLTWEFEVLKEIIIDKYIFTLDIRKQPTLIRRSIQNYLSKCSWCSLYLEQLEEMVMDQHQQTEEEQLENRLISYMLEEGPVMYRDKAYQKFSRGPPRCSLVYCICLCLPLSCIAKLNWLLKQKCYIII
jgi:hypothetical protein